MFRRLRERLTFANAISLVALFVALGGTGYAALKLPSNSVGTKQLKSSAVTTGKIHNGAVTSAKLGCQSNGGVVGDVSIVNAATIGPAFQSRPAAGNSAEWNCSGKPVRVARLSEGSYVVQFPGVKPGQGVVTPHATNRLATVDDAAGGADPSIPEQSFGFRVHVTDLTGVAKDGDFTLAGFTAHFNSK